MNHVRNQLMLLEDNVIPRSNSQDTHQPRDEQQTTTQFTVTGKFDPLKISICPAPIPSQNKYSALEDEIDDDDSEHENDDNLCIDKDMQKRKQRAHNPNKRQRLQNRRRLARQHHDNHDEEIE